MKRKVSLLLVLALMLTLVPMSAFATSSNRVNAIPKVSDDYSFTTSDAPNLRIEEADNDFGTTAQTFRLKLDNAEWLDTATFAADMGHNGSTIIIERLTDTTVEASVYGTATEDEAFNFPMLAKIQGKGDAKVTVDPRDSAVTGGTYTFAVGAAGDTVATIDGTNDFTDNVTIKDIEIEETSINAIGAVNESKVKLKLPSDFKWVNTSITSANISFTGGLSGASLGSTATVIDGNTLEFYFDNPGTGTTRGSIFLKGLQVTAKNEADYGDVTLDISGDDISSADLVVAKYVDYDVTIKADGDAKELISGRMASSYSDDEHKLQTLVIEESVDNSWLTSRKTRIEFPSWVKILGADITSDTENMTVTGFADGEFTDKGDNYVEFTATQTAGEKAKLYVKFYVSVEAGKTGDIVAKVSGRSLTNDAEVVLGKAMSPVSVEAEGGDVKTGIKNQEVGNIVIKEVKKEAIKKGTLTVELGDSIEWASTPKVEVTEGNLDLDEEAIDTDGSLLTIPVKSDSSKPATITISGVKVDLDRTIPEGEIDVKVKGNAVVENQYDSSDSNKELKDGYFDESTATKAVVATVVTPADSDTKAAAEVKFVIGQAEYQVGEEVKTADVAPYIADGRTMLSLRFVAEAVGVANENIIWDGATRTVTIFKGDRIAQVEIGSNKLFVNGVVVPMDTEAVIKDGRTMLPIRFIAQALGAEVEWDGATRTVTVK